MKTVMKTVMSVVASLCLVGLTAGAADLSPIEQLGKQLFFDTNLSSPAGQSCAACHGPEVGFTGPVSEINADGAVYPGALPPRFGNRKPPTAAYGGDSPVMYYHEKSELIVGGMFSGASMRMICSSSSPPIESASTETRVSTSRALPSMPVLAM